MRATLTPNPARARHLAQLLLTAYATTGIFGQQAMPTPPA